MSEAPSRIWIDPEGTISRVKIIFEDVEYIRADIVEEMREALEELLVSVESIGTNKAKAALKRLEEE